MQECLELFQTNCFSQEASKKRKKKKHKQILESHIFLKWSGLASANLMCCALLCQSWYVLTVHEVYLWSSLYIQNSKAVEKNITKTVNFLFGS